MIDSSKILTYENKSNSFVDPSDRSNQNYLIWKAYHDESQKSKYNLQNTDNIVIFNTTNIGYNGKCFNYLNRFLSEWCCLVYPWLNNIKSNFIGFQHYKRYFNINKIDFELLKDNTIQYFHSHFPNKTFFNYFTPTTDYLNIEAHAYFWNQNECGFKDDLIEFLKVKYPKYLDGEKNQHEFYGYDIFVCNWEIYCQLAKFLFDYIEFINNKYNLEWSEIKWYSHIQNNFARYILENNINIYKAGCMSPFYYGFDEALYSLDGYLYKGKSPCNCFRIYSMNIEYLTSVFIFNNKKYFDENNQLKS